VTGPVDGVFHRGAFYFGTSPEAVRWRHLRRNPAVSATHLRSEDWAVIVHGTAVPADVSRTDRDGLRATLLEAYTPRYGARWEEFLDSGPVYARIAAERMFALDVTAGQSRYSAGDHPHCLTAAPAHTPQPLLRRIAEYDRLSAFRRQRRSAHRSAGSGARGRQAIGTANSNPSAW
jgi:hypothetical protein